MNAPDDNADRRSAYRYSPPRLLEPQINLIHAGGRVPVVEVFDINAYGARLGFTVSRRTELRPGIDVQVAAQAPGLDGVVDIAARVVFSVVRAQRLAVGLVFAPLPDVGERADGVFFSIFNRRADERAEQAFEARLTAPVEDPAHRLQVLNHSGRGIGFVVEPGLDRLLRERSHVELEMTLPGSRGDRRVTAEVRHRADLADTVYYGCRLAGAA